MTRRTTVPLRYGLAAVYYTHAEIAAQERSQARKKSPSRQQAPGKDNGDGDPLPQPIAHQHHPKKELAA
jgi:hypothetical protein